MINGAADIESSSPKSDGVSFFFRFEVLSIHLVLNLLSRQGKSIQTRRSELSEVLSINKER